LDAGEIEKAGDENFPKFSKAQQKKLAV